MTSHKRRLDKLAAQISPAPLGRMSTEEWAATFEFVKARLAERREQAKDLIGRYPDTTGQYRPQHLPDPAPTTPPASLAGRVDQAEWERWARAWNEALERVSKYPPAPAQPTDPQPQDPGPPGPEPRQKGVNGVSL